MVKVFLKPNRRKRLEGGHPWVFRSEIARVEDGDVPVSTPKLSQDLEMDMFSHLDLAEVYNHAGYFLALGFYNPDSEIAVRILAYSQIDIDAQWFEEKIATASERRRWMLPATGSYRVIYGEADFLPGLIVDKYGDFLVVQILSRGMDNRREWIFAALRKILQPRGIYERSDVAVRKLEGLAERAGFVGTEFDTSVTIEEHSLRITIDVAEGQKTGYFFDQRENRAALQRFMTGWGKKRGVSLNVQGQPLDIKGKIIKNPFWDGAEVLDCFAHTGSFMLHACLYGAKKVTCVDVSDRAIAMARQNALQNGFLHRTEFVEANAFDYLREQVKAGRQWDIVILDPPAFAKSRQALQASLRGYKEINLQGIKLIRPGGLLVSASCSYHLRPDVFMDTIHAAAMDAHKILRLVEFRRAGLDHPVLLGSEETDYLKFAIFEVFDRK